MWNKKLEYYHQDLNVYKGEWTGWHRESMFSLLKNIGGSLECSSLFGRSEIYYKNVRENCSPSPSSITSIVIKKQGKRWHL